MGYQNGDNKSKDYLVAYLGLSIGHVPIDPPKSIEDLTQTIKDIYLSRGQDTLVRKVSKMSNSKYLGYSYEFDVGPTPNRKHTWSTGNIWLTNPRDNDNSKEINS